MTTNITSHAEDTKTVMAHITELRKALTDWATFGDDGFRDPAAATRAIEETDAILVLIYSVRSKVIVERRRDSDTFMAHILANLVAEMGAEK